MSEKKKKIRLQCPCGELLVADSEDELVDLANAHLEKEHPEMAGSYTRDQILVMSY
jgi:predicted small metal-binding protein